MDILNTKIKNILTEKTLKVRPENIKKDVSILGITGTYTADADATANDIKTGKTAYVNGNKITGEFNGVDTSDADATAGNILNNKTAYVDGTKLTGSMPNNGSLSYTPSDSSQSIPAGYTSGGTVAATDITTLNDYQSCLEIADAILEGVPPYIEVEYIESSGSQYIATGINVGDIELRFQAKVMGTESRWQQDGFMWSSYYNNNYGLGDFYGDSQNGRFNIYWGNNQSINTNISFSPNVAYVVDCTFDKTSYDVTVDNSNFTGTHSSWYPSNAPLVLFKRGNNSQYPFYGRIYYCKIYCDDVLTRDFIPVKDLNGVACMYDKVSETFFYNQGTGTFTPGGEI